MRAKPLTILAAIMVLGGSFVFGATIVRALFWAPNGEVSLPPGEVAHTLDIPPSEIPERLIIPSLDIDTDVQDVGIGKSGNMAVPSNYSDVGWYRYGTVPGQVGSAVMDGHADNGFALPGVFKHLEDIEKGADVYVVTRAGTRLHFKVVEVTEYPLKEVPLEKLFNRSDASRLNLITCTGRWIKGDETYDHRVVVYTQLVGTDEGV
jgi:sortase (surface protein transpeptidase)